MNNVKGALTRKFGPLPAWAWFLILGLAYYFYQKYQANNASGTGTGSVAQTPPTPQPGQVLEPGESYYDPNTGTLSTAPGGDTSGGGSIDPNALGAAIAAAISANMPADQTGGGDPIADPGTAPPGNPPGTTSPGNNAKKPPKLTAKGAVRAPFGHNRPAARAGYTIKGLGKGFWEYVPKRVAKPKGQQKAQAKTSKPNNPAHKSAGRSTAIKRTTNGGRTSGVRSAPTTTTRHRVTSAPKGQQPSRARQRPRTPAVTTTLRQRPAAQTPRPSPSRQTGAPAPRPSAPATRTVRSPQRPAPRRSTRR